VSSFFFWLVVWPAELMENENGNENGGSVGAPGHFPLHNNRSNLNSFALSSAVQ
jgi:hypothetical protein